MMLQLLVVDELDDRRDATADALCELPGVEVSASAPDAERALEVLDHTQADVVVAASDMAGASIVTLIDSVRRSGTADIIVMVTNRVTLPGMREYWRDLGACAVVDTLPELVAQVQASVGTRATTSGGGAVSEERPPSGSAAIVAVDEVLRAALPQLARLVSDEIRLVLEVGSYVPHVRSSVTDIERIAVHLMRDAAAAIPLGGTIWFFVERDGARHVRIEVLDSGGHSRHAVLPAIVAPTN
jgi:signal transduction histidine kinase